MGEGCHSTDKTEVDWSELIVVLSSLIRSIESLRSAIALDEDDLYEAEEELNDYVMLLARLCQRYSEIPNNGELSEPLAKKLREIC